jgi:predicted metalloprotease
MRWQGQARSGNVQDRRGMGRGAVGGGIGLLLAVVLSLMFGVDPTQIIQTQPEAPPPGVDDPGREFVEVVLADTEETWNAIFQQRGQQYVEPTLVLFSDAVQSACGMAGAAVGPFYCPGDQQVYLDLSFFDALDRQLGAPGDFARAYVIAHEVGHHVQTLLGTSDQVARLRQQVGETQANALSVRVELQADCYAGVWANHANRETNFLDPGDIEEALGAASAIGDDRLQRRSQGQVVPESFTHGTSEQRARWFRTGFEAGTPEACDTFNQG